MPRERFMDLNFRKEGGLGCLLEDVLWCVVLWCVEGGKKKKEKKKERQTHNF